MSTQLDDETVKMLLAWARQTIALAIAIRAEDVGRKLSEDAVAKGSIDQAYELWELTVRRADDVPEYPHPVHLSAYSRAVFEWCDSHMNR